MYSEKVMEHFEHPRNVGEIPDASGAGTVGNAKCGDIMKMDIKVENDVITDVKFKTFGCCAAIATSSMATEMVKGKSIDEALATDQQGRGRGARRAAPGEDALLASGGAGDPRRGGGLSEKAPQGIIRGAERTAYARDSWQHRGNPKNRAGRADHAL